MAKSEKSADKSFIEIVNWKRAQPKMRKGENQWLKLYTSLLDHDGFAGLSDTSRMLIVALWLYAARSGLHILPADPKWIKRKIPMLSEMPDLGPLIDAVDCYGNPTPFVRYCPAPAESGKSRSKAGKRKAGTPVATRTRGAQEKKRREEKREEKQRTDETLAGFEREEEREKKERVTQPLGVIGERRKCKSRQSKARGQKTEQTAEEEPEKPEKPENPMESEAGSAKALHTVPKPTRSVNRGPQRLGSVIADWLPEHWRDADAEAFGWEIVEALGMPRDPVNLNSRSEWGAFASFWVRVKGSVDAGLLDELRRIAVVKAEYVRWKVKSARNKSAVLFTILKKELDHRGVRLPEARAGP